MVNSEDFVKRIERLLEYYGVSASAFADAIGVQRSAMSHLLSGRNKPSLDFVLKIVEVYTEVDLYWLLKGQGSFPRDTGQIPAPPPPQPTAPQLQDLFPHSAAQPHTESRIDANAAPDRTKDSRGEIERVVLFHQDGTFTSYTPK